MKTTLLTLTLILTALTSAQVVPFQPNQSLPAGEYEVFRVIDADTISVLVAPPAPNPASGGTVSGGAVSGGAPVVEPVERSVRIAEVDAPEMRPLQPFAQEATQFARDLLTGTTVYLTPAEPPTDRYGRALAYVELEDDRDLSMVLAQAGLADLYNGEPSLLTPLYAAAIAGAKSVGKGMHPAQAFRDRNCPDFDSQTEAEAFYLGARTENRVDPHRLDAAPRDGVACNGLSKR